MVPNVQHTDGLLHALLCAQRESQVSACGLRLGCSLCHLLGGSLVHVLRQCNDTVSCEGNYDTFPSSDWYKILYIKSVISYF